MLLPIFHKYPDEGAMVGKILAGYSELEVSLMGCVIEVHGEVDTVFKVMYRNRGEKQRIDVADAMGRHTFDGLGLGAQFATAIGAMHYCRQIRNQFAHCQWWGDSSGYLTFLDLESVARENAKITSFRNFEKRRANLQLLEAQVAYFEHVLDILIFLQHEVMLRLGRAPSTIPFHTQRH
jgi:hypothetical protein